MLIKTIAYNWSENNSQAESDVERRNVTPYVWPKINKTMIEIDNYAFILLLIDNCPTKI